MAATSTSVSKTSTRPEDIQPKDTFMILVTYDGAKDIITAHPNPFDPSVVPTHATYQDYYANDKHSRYTSTNVWFKDHPTIRCKNMQEHNRIMAIIENKYPVYMMRKHIPHFVITFPTIHELHRNECNEWLKSHCLRRMDRPEVVDTHVEVESTDSLITQSEIEQALRDLIKRRSRWVSIPDPKLIQTKINVEAAAVMKLFKDEPSIVRTLLDTPVLFPAFTSLKCQRKISRGSTHDFLSLIALEYAHVAGKIPFSEKNMCVSRLDNPFFGLIKMTPENQDKALSLVTHGISDMIDYSKGAYLSGSMIAAAIQYIKNGDLQKLEANYPRVYTELCPEYDKSDLRRCIFAKTIGLATVSFSVKEEKLIVTFEFDPSKEVVSSNYFSFDIYRLGKAAAESKYPKQFAFTFAPGCDIDILVEVNESKPDNVKMIAVDLLGKMAKKWPGAYLRIITEKHTTPMFRITIDDMKARFAGFRDLKIYPSADPPSQIATYHVTAVRAWKSIFPGIYATASAFQGHNSMITDHHHFTRKSQPWEVLDKYATRGFKVDISGYNELRTRMGYEAEFVNLPSNIGLVGKFCFMPPALGKDSKFETDFPELSFDETIHEELEQWRASLSQENKSC